MRNVILMLMTVAALAVSACGSNGNNNSSPNTNVAAIPQACGTNIPSQYCTGYNTSTYGNYGTGYGCPAGYQAMYVGSYYGYGYSTYGGNNAGYTCVQSTYMSGFGYTPYYAGGYASQACNPYASNCPYGTMCYAMSYNFGYCH